MSEETNNDDENISQEQNIFSEEKDLFELTKNIDYTQLNKAQQTELKKQLNPSSYETYIYDMDIDPQITEKYEVGEYLYQPTDIYTTQLITKPTKNVRYLIFSKEFQKISDEELIPEYQNIDLSVTGVLSCFKIIDISKKDELTQITLLHYNSFEEILIKHHKTEIEEKAIKISKEILEKEEYVNRYIDLEEINYKITTAIGINNREAKLKPFTKDQIIFYLDVLSELLNKYNLDDIFEFTDEYDIVNIINIYQKSIDELGNIDVNKDEYLEEKEEIIKAYKKTIINSLELSDNLKETEIKTEISEDFENKDSEEQLKEISEILNIPQEKLEKIINTKK